MTDLAWDEYLLYERRMKPAPAFDGIYHPSWENSLFGSATVDNQHFTQYSFKTSYSTWEAPLADWGLVKMMNPMYYIDASGTTTSDYWRIRHGALDADTSVAIPVILATKLMNTGHDVDFAVPWDQGHGGNYDLEELFNWIESISGQVPLKEFGYWTGADKLPLPVSIGCRMEAITYKWGDGRIESRIY